ncbi:MAG: hypothetical protein PHX82_00350 [Paracoccaceae bacterium]|nr:hypothetical protein [Paracoccaceae bacterium]
MTFPRLAYLLSRLAYLSAAVLALGWMFLVAQPLLFPGLIAPEIPAEAAGMVVHPLAYAASRAVLVLVVAPAVCALIHAAQLMHGFARGEVLTETAARHVRRIGVAILVRAALMVPTQTAAVALLTITNPAGKRLLSVGVSSDLLEAVVYGGLLLLIAAAIQTGARAAAENAEFV